ncbi:MAG: acyltransferase [Bdellovibrionaceae bacterium]|nr:acyltransferase [Pseudobdellovibrionaceae bacterium]
MLIFHIHHALLPGGFIGVDVFFVLSGYLITSNIYEQMMTNTFSFIDFYTRRIKRLLPSLYFVLVIFTTIASFLFLPEDLRTVQESLKKIVIFLANQYFASGRDYFAPQTSETLFLHTWSLAIEEQFYFVWPLLLFLVIKTGARKSTIIVIAIFATMASLVYGQYLLYNHEVTFAYYSFFSRFGELLAGAILAILKTRSSSKTAPYLTALGLVLIAASCVVIQESSPFPGLLATLPCVGALLFLYSAANPLRSVFSKQPWVYIGQISYQLYLWHWPFLALARYLEGQYSLSNTSIILPVLGTFLCSVFAHHLIEKPLRYHRTSFWKSVGALHLAPICLLVLILILGRQFEFKTKYFKNPEIASYGTDICHGEIKQNGCIKGDLSKAPGLFLFGDSHAAHLNTFFDELGKSQGWSALITSGSSCPGIVDFNENFINTPAALTFCREFKNFILKEIENHEQIGISARWEWNLGLAGEPHDPDFIKKLEKTLRLLERKKKKVFIFSQVPAMSNSPQRTELFRARLHSAITPSENEDSRVTQANHEISRLTSKYKNVTYVDLYKAMKSSENPFWDEGTPLYLNKDHMNQRGAKALFQRALQNKNLRLPPEARPIPSGN